MAIDIEAFAETLAKELEGYSASVAKSTKRAVDKTAKEVNKIIKSHATFGGTGEYKKAMRLSVRYESKTEKRIIWHVKAPHYRLAHLLERGHQKRGGGRTRAFPHIEYGEKYVTQNLQKNIAEEIERGD